MPSSQVDFVENDNFHIRNCALILGMKELLFFFEENEGTACIVPSSEQSIRLPDHGKEINCVLAVLYMHVHVHVQVNVHACSGNDAWIYQLGNLFVEHSRTFFT